ncbi:MAG: hypothetical protein MUQ27_07935, partial [Acidimicrobiia bacterium]|nr:hypothetical protein [Acidimicrobiia bacterium]
MGELPSSAVNWVRWHAFLDAASTDRAQSIVRRIGEAVGLEIETVSVERYWKDPSLMDVRMRSPFVTGAAEEAHAHINDAMSRLTSTFISSAP